MLSQSTFDESGVFTDNGYVRSNGGRFVEIYDGRIEESFAEMEDEAIVDFRKTDET